MSDELETLKIEIARQAHQISVLVYRLNNARRREFNLMRELALYSMTTHGGPSNITGSDDTEADGDAVPNVR